MYDDLFVEAGGQLLDQGGFKASIQKLALIENLLVLSEPGNSREALQNDGAIEGLAGVLSEVVGGYFAIASKVDAEIKKRSEAETKKKGAKNG
jgi:hypothetical protein